MTAAAVAANTVAVAVAVVRLGRLEMLGLADRPLPMLAAAAVVEIAAAIPVQTLQAF
ncbi:MAG: hypothetical protein ABIW84_08730 [Ilumatobacteraceae bacterium]